MVESAAITKTLNWQKVTEVLPQALLLVSIEGVVIFANLEAKRLLSRMLVDEKWSDIVHDAFESREDDGLQVSLKDGRKIQVSIGQLPDSLGQMIMLSDLTSFRDYEHQKEKQARLAEMGQMLAELAHQIRTPLSAAMLYGENLKQHNVTEEKRLNFINKLCQCLKNIEVQIRDLLLFAKGGESLLQSTSMENCLSDIKTQVSGAIDEKKVDLSFQNDLADTYFVAHLETLKGALCNLIENAILANAKKIIFKVGLYQQKALVFSVIDDGDGMDEKTLKKAKDAFFTTRAKGTGLGLAVVDAVCKAHGGYLDIQSEATIGSIFSVFIPFIKGQAND